MDGQAADVDALEPSQALAGTAWEVLERTGTLCLVLDAVDAGDVFAAALVCKPFHASLVQRWPIWRPPLLLRQCPARTPMVIIATHIDDFEDDAGEPCPCQSTGHHFRTSVRDLALSTSRLEWAQSLGEHGPAWLQERAVINPQSSWFVYTYCGRAIYQNPQAEPIETSRSPPKEGIAAVYEQSGAEQVRVFDSLWASAYYSSSGTDTCRRLAKAGQVEAVQWAHAAGYLWCERTSKEAARGGHLRLLQWLLSSGCPHDTSEYADHPLSRAAVEGGHAEVLQWLLDNHRGVAMEEQVEWKQFDSEEEWRASPAHRLDPNAWPVWSLTGVAADAGQVAALEWLIDRFPWMRTSPGHGNSYSWSHIGHMAIMDHCDKNTPVGKIQEVLEWIFAENLLTDAQLPAAFVSSAAQKGYLGLLQWLHSQGRELAGCAFDAAESGNLEMIQWLQEVGENLHARAGEQYDHSDWTVLSNAAACGHLSVVRWLHEDLSLGWGGDTESLWEEAACSYHFDVLQYMQVCVDPRPPPLSFSLSALASLLRSIVTRLSLTV